MVNSNTSQRVVEELRSIAEAGAPGDRLPTVRELMARHGVGPTTVQRAVSRLAREGLIEAKPGRGSFVAPRPEPPDSADLGWQSMALGERTLSYEGLNELKDVPASGVVPLASGYPSEDLQPVSQLAAAMKRASRRPGAWSRTPVEGIEDLRAWFAREVGGGLRAHDVVITSGGQAALFTAFRALAPLGAPVLFESPTYVGALAAARAAGLRPVPVPTDERGVRPDLLEEAIFASGARLFYCQPTYANPHGAVLHRDRREAVLEVVRSAKAFLVEDDWARDLAIEDEPPRPLASGDPDGHVVYVRSLTKPMAPGMRVAALCARGAAGTRLRTAQVASDFFVAGPLQEAALEVVSSPAWDRHRRRVRKALRERRDALVALVRERLPGASLALVPRGGLHLWVKLPGEIDDAHIAAEAVKAGVVVNPGRHWFPAEPTGSFLRLGFAGAEIGALSEGVDVLSEVLDTAARELSP